MTAMLSTLFNQSKEDVNTLKEQLSNLAPLPSKIGLLEGTIQEKEKEINTLRENVKQLL